MPVRGQERVALPTERRHVRGGDLGCRSRASIPVRIGRDRTEVRTDGTDGRALRWLGRAREGRSREERMDNRYHRGYRIRVRSFRTGARWRTEVVIATMKVPDAELTLPLPPVHWSA